MLDVPDCELTRDEVIARNLAVVEAHFHNENPERIDAALRLYTDDIVWEGPSRGNGFRCQPMLPTARKSRSMDASMSPTLPTRRTQSRGRAC